MSHDRPIAAIVIHEHHFRIWPWPCKNASSRTIARTNFSEVAPGTRKIHFRLLIANMADERSKRGCTFSVSTQPRP
jgi:hypothetical protein